MKLENQVVSLELAKKLKELGVKQESLFYWWNNQIYFYPYLDQTEIGDSISAFTVAELGILLPTMSDLPKQGHDGRWRVHGPWTAEKGDLLHIADTEADCRAKVLIYLLENNLIKN